MRATAAGDPHDQLAALAISERQAPVTPADVYRKLSARLTDW